MNKDRRGFISTCGLSILSHRSKIYETQCSSRFISTIEIKIPLIKYREVFFYLHYVLAKFFLLPQVVYSKCN